MKRKIVVNCFLAFVILPVLFFIQYYRGEISRGYPNTYTLYENIGRFFYVYGYMLPSALFTLFILLPFQSIKDNMNDNHKPFSFVGKWMTISALIMFYLLLCGMFLNIWMIPWWHNFAYPVFALGLGGCANILLYFMVDRHVEKSNKPEVMHVLDQLN